LGLTEKVKSWAGEIPDARTRLSYIARLTGEAAEKVLNNVDQAKRTMTTLPQKPAVLVR
jgi:chemotaxis protein CheZ